MRPSVFALLAWASGAAAHGYVSFPPARQVGNASTAACGILVTSVIKADNTSHVEGLPEEAAQPNSGYNATLCNLWMCKGIQFGDNTANVQQYKPGDNVEMKVLITIPHDGLANVSIVDTAANEIIGDMLVVWPSHYANETEFHAGTLPKNQPDFNFTMPDVSDRCRKPGACVLQWWWYGTAAKQTYESCVDFTMMEV